MRLTRTTTRTTHPFIPFRAAVKAAAPPALARGTRS